MFCLFFFLFHFQDVDSKTTGFFQFFCLFSFFIVPFFQHFILKPGVLLNRSLAAVTSDISAECLSSCFSVVCTEVYKDALMDFCCK